MGREAHSFSCLKEFLRASSRPVSLTTQITRLLRVISSFRAHHLCWKRSRVPRPLPFPLSTRNPAPRAPVELRKFVIADPVGRNRRHSGHPKARHDVLFQAAEPHQKPSVGSSLFEVKFSLYIQGARRILGNTE